MSNDKHRNIYKGHRYVPLIDGEWDKNKSYEGLTVVTHQGNSYTSKKHVPVGIDILNTDYWVVTGNYNAQIEHYRQEVRDMQEQVDSKASKEDVSYLQDQVDSKASQTDLDETNHLLAQTINDINMYGAIAHLHGVVGDYDPVTKTGTDVTQKLQELINDYPVVYLFGGNYLITDTIDIPSDRLIYGFNADVYFDLNSEDRKHNITIRNKYDVEIKGINFHALPSSRTSHMLNITYSENINIHNNLFDGGSTYQNGSFTGGGNGGIYVFEGNENVLIEQNIVKNMRTGHGIQTGNSKDVVIKDNIISYTARAGVSINSGTENCTVKGNIISYSQMDFTFDAAIDIYGYAPICKNILIEGNNISNIGNDTFTFSKENSIIRIKDVDGVIVRHNKITIDHSIYAIFILQQRELYENGGRMDNVTIFDNEIEIFATFNHICRVRADYLVENFKFNHNKFKSRHVLVGEETFGFADIRVFAHTSNIEICYNNFDFENETYGESNNLIINMKDINYEHSIVKIAGNTCNTRKRFVEIVNGKRVIISSNNINSRVGGSIIKVDDGTVVLVDGNVINSFTATNKVDVTGSLVKDENNLVTDSFY